MKKTFATRPILQKTVFSNLVLPSYSLDGGGDEGSDEGESNDYNDLDTAWSGDDSDNDSNDSDGK